MSNISVKDFRLYLTNWRDATMLRLIEAFLESAPQIVIQLYILSTFNRSIIWDKDWITILAALVSIVSLAWSIVSYAHALRLCARRKGLSICGYIFQVIYRFLMVTSRIAALALFAAEYKWIVIVVVFVHWVVMIYWVQSQETNFCSSSNKNVETWFEKMFCFVIAFLYIFCFINTQEGTSRKRVTFYYILFFTENSLMIAAWYPTRKSDFGILEYGALSVVWGGFLLGLLSMLMYYKLFHPNQDITAGWCCWTICNTDDVESEANKPFKRNEYDLETISSPEGIIKEGTPRTVKHQHSLIKKSHSHIPVDVEFSIRGEFPLSNDEKSEKVYQYNAENGTLEKLSLSNGFNTSNLDMKNGIK